MTSIHFTLCSFFPTSFIVQALLPPTLSPSHTSSSSFLYRYHLIPTLLSALHLHTHPSTCTTHTHPFLRCEEVLTSSCVNALVAVVFLGAVKPEFAGTYVSTAVQNIFFNRKISCCLSLYGTILNIIFLAMGYLKFNLSSLCYHHSVHYSFSILYLYVYHLHVCHF